MDFSLKQWRDEQHDQSEDEHQQPSAKIPRNHQQQQDYVPAALPLFVSEPYSSTIPSSFPTPTPTFSRVGGRNCFSIAQWQELEVQALIYRHIVAGATIPADLLYLVKNSLLSSSPYYLHHYPPHFQPAASLMQGGYWGKGGMDPEPGRCRRTDGKKWRCSRDIVAGHKYCERHVHRGRNRSRKPVEFPAIAATGGGGGGESLSKPSATFNGGAAHFSLPGSGTSSFDAFKLHTGSEELRSDNKSLFDTQHNSASTDAKSNKVLMHFFDDWPRSLHDSGNPDTNANNLSSTSLSISTPSPTPGNSTSDFLKLSTGNGDDLGNRDGYATADRDRGQISWTGAWAGNPVVSMGGPLAEALGSSSNSSPTRYHCSTPVA